MAKFSCVPGQAKNKCTLLSENIRNVLNIPKKYPKMDCQREKDKKNKKKKETDTR